MLTQITKRSTRSKKDAELLKKLKWYSVQALKMLVRYVLLRPMTWRLLQVYIPELGEKTESIVKEFIAWVSDIF